MIEKYEECPHGKPWATQAAYDMQRCSCEHLKPCPFCGGEAEIVNAEECGPRAYVVSCAVCGASSNVRFALKEDVRPLLVMDWNKRRERAREMADDKSRMMDLARILLFVNDDFFDEHEIRGAAYRFRMPDEMEADMAFEMAEPAEQTRAMALARAAIEFLK